LSGPPKQNLRSILPYRSPRYTKLIQQFQLPPKLRDGDFAAQQLAILFNRLLDLPGRFVQEF